MAPLDDDSLLTRLSVGDERAFGELYDREASRLYRAALAMLGRPQDAEDAVQEVFMAMVRGKRKLTEVRGREKGTSLVLPRPT